MSNTLFDLTGKVAVVTGAGANGGIGHALALGFAQHGADVVVADIDTAGVTTTAEEIQALGRRTLAVTCDIAQPAQVEALFNAADQ
ncbi:MAG: SDR family NAD(P)-dependent oxidoreductase, partial [Chloroflexota bacterium]|nr:SDR family NAD(P)-dependent oxidoreductase [Chloroflexota bacterium]